MKKLLDFALNLTGKYREIIMYGIFGVLTTAVNWIAYVICIEFFTGGYANLLASAIAWILAVLFAYFTNRKWVFESKARGLSAVVMEVLFFFASRLLSGVLDMGIMYFFVDVLWYNGKIVKLLSNILVIIINYILSKFIVFKAK